MLIQLTLILVLESARLKAVHVHGIDILSFVKKTSEKEMAKVPIVR